MSEAAAAAAAMDETDDEGYRPPPKSEAELAAERAQKQCATSTTTTMDERLKRAKGGLKTRLSPALGAPPPTVVVAEAKQRTAAVKKKRKSPQVHDRTSSVDKEAPVKVKGDIQHIITQFQKNWAPILRREQVELVVDTREHNLKFTDVLFQLNRVPGEEADSKGKSAKSTSSGNSRAGATAAGESKKTKSKLISLNDEDDRPASSHLEDMDSSTDQDSDDDDEKGGGSRKDKDDEIAAAVPARPDIVLHTTIAAGDFWIRIKGKLAFVFERKTVADLSGSIGGHSDRQKFKLKRLPIPLSRCYYLIEGRKPAGPFVKAREVLMGAMTNIMVRDRFQVIHTPSDEDTVLLLLELLIKVGEYVLGETSSPSLVSVHAYQRWQAELAMQIVCPLGIDPLRCLPRTTTSTSADTIAGASSASATAAAQVPPNDEDYLEDFERNETKYEAKNATVVKRLLDSSANDTTATVASSAGAGSGASISSRSRSSSSVSVTAPLKTIAAQIPPSKIAPSRLCEEEMEYLEAWCKGLWSADGGKSDCNNRTMYVRSLTVINRMTYDRAAAIFNHFDCSQPKMQRFFADKKRTPKEIQKEIANILFASKASKVVRDKQQQQLDDSDQRDGKTGASKKTAAKSTGSKKGPKKMRRIGPALAKALYGYMLSLDDD